MEARVGLEPRNTGLVSVMKDVPLWESLSLTHVMSESEATMLPRVMNPVSSR